MTKVLGITGGIGAGKSYVSDLLRSFFSIPVYDCDREASRLMVSHDAIIQGLKDLIGDEAYEGPGRLNKAVVAAYLFSDEAHSRQIDGLVHPVVRDDFWSWVKSQSGPIVCMESAILYESGFDNMVDKVLFVAAPESVRIDRVMRRSGLTREQVVARIRMQRSSEFLSRASYVISNDGVDDVALTQRLKAIIASM